MKFYTTFSQFGNQTLVREIKNGVRSKFKYKYSPSLYVLSDEGEYSSIQGDKLSPVHFETVKEAKEFVSQYKGTENYPIFGNPRFHYSAIEELYPSIPGELGIQYDESLINILYIDIETASGGERGFPSIELANHEVNAITVIFRGKSYTLGLEDIDPEIEGNTYYFCQDEETLLRKFIKLWKQIDPDIVTGWNIKFFDIIYLVNRIDTVLGDEYKELSPWGIVNKRQEKITENQILPYAEIVGVCVLDYIPLYKKFRLQTQESYKLDFIAYVELGDKKMDYSEQGSLYDLYTKDYKKFIAYNVKDTELINRLENKLGYISLACVIAYMTKTNYDDVFENIRLWDVIISSFLLKKNIIIPYSSGDRDSDGYEGAFVKPTIPGKYDWIVSFDLTSLYPSIIRSFNISPDVDLTSLKGLTAGDFIPELNGINPSTFINTPDLIEKIVPILKEKNINLCANGTLYSRHKKSFLADLSGLYFDERKKSKKKMLELEREYEKTKDIKTKTLANHYDAKQNAQKIIVNSLYGSLGSQYFRLYCQHEAMAITITGQTIIQRITNQLNSYMNKICGTDNKDYAIASDTDSVYLDFSNFTNKFLNGKTEIEIVDALSKVCATKFQDQIKIAIDDLCRLTNAFENHIDMKRESIGQAVFVAKKRYFMRVHDSEGVRYEKPKMKIVGLEAVRSTTPEYCRKKLKEIHELILTKDEMTIIETIEKIKKEFMSLPLYDISLSTGVSDLSKYHVEEGFMIRSPIHVKAAITYNRLVKKLNLSNKYESIKDGDKIKYILLKTPNPVFNDTIGFITHIPKEFEIEKYIDKEEQFNKTFLNGLIRILDIIGWKHDRSVSLDDFFS